MLPTISFGEIEFAEPHVLWLLLGPALLLVLWVWALLRRRRDRRRLVEQRLVPVRERFALVADLPYWLCLTLAIASVVVALARPRGPAQVIQQGGIDLVILQDASASMRVKDVPGDRWQRSTKFLRLMGDALGWKNDRIALAIFAHIAAPQIRLTTDPNTFFFFLDHLAKEPPFRIQEDTTWDTNLALGLHWGLRMIERDEEIHGPSPNAKVFIVISDGELWSGDVEEALEEASSRNIPVFVVGVGTLGGGRMPAFLGPEGEEVNDPDVPVTSRLDRPALQRLASAGGGQYFELDRDGDRAIANAIIDVGKRIAPVLAVTEDAEELYWYFLSLAALFLLAGLPFIRERAELALHFSGAVLALIGLTRILS